MVSVVQELFQHVFSILDFTKIFATTHPSLLSLPVTYSSHELIFFQDILLRTTVVIIFTFEWVFSHELMHYVFS